MEVFAREVVTCNSPLLFGFSRSGLLGIARQVERAFPGTFSHLVDLSYGVKGETPDERQSRIIDAFMDAIDMMPKPS